MNTSNKRKHFEHGKTAAKRYRSTPQESNSNPLDIPFETKHGIKKKNQQRSSLNSQLIKAECADSPSLDALTPRGINVYQYAVARAFEIKNLKTALQDAKGAQNNLAFQQLPRHMRRRAASHDIRRLPRRLREKASSQMAPQKVKAKTRKQKRRPKNLLEEYQRRSRKHCWLETHIWHAKRFKMIEQWGYKIAERPCDKSFRAAYRSISKSCLLQDKSYMEVIEIIGLPDEMILQLNKMLPPHTGQKFDDLDCLTGICYGEVVLYKDYPYIAIGPVKFLWAMEKDAKIRKLLLVVHPSISEEILSHVKELLKVQNIDTVTSQDLQQDSEMNNSGEKGDNQILNVMKLRHHKLNFVMFSLTGPQSFYVLQNVLCTVKNENEDNINTSKEKSNDIYWTVMSENRLQKLGKSIFNLTVEDPRLHKPNKKQNVLLLKNLKMEVAEGKAQKEHKTKVFPSRLWDDDARTLATSKKLHDHKINEMRSQLLVPGSKLDVSSVQIPVVLLHHPPVNQAIMGDTNRGKTFSVSGFEIILPAGWGMPFLLSFVYQGVRVGGLQEDRKIHFEHLNLHFPSNFPDTLAGKTYAEQISKRKEDEYSRRPPAKRVNHDCLGITNPFRFPWEQLIKQWSYNLKDLLPTLCEAPKLKPQESFYVIRDSCLLSRLDTLLKNKCSIDKSLLLEVLHKHLFSLVPVRVYSKVRGCPEDNSPLYIPKVSDFDSLQKALDDPLTDKYNGPVEPVHKGLKKDFPYVCKEHHILRHNALDIGVNTRWLVGYTQNGQYSFSRGKGSGIGFVSMAGLIYLLHKDSENQLLFRNINSLEYKFCYFDIVNDE